jgi:glucose-1-phosphatase
LKPRAIKAAIFDLGNVLVDVDAGVAAERVAALGGKPLCAAFFESSLMSDFETGKLSPEDFFSSVKSLLSLEIGYGEFLQIWNEIFSISEKNLLVRRLVQNLSGNMPVVMLTNTNVLHYEYLIKAWPGLFAPFHHVITSFEAGSRKPEAAIYRVALSRLNCAPEEAFYTDDRPELIEAANRLGIRGSVFAGFEKLKNDLAGEGVQTDAHTA